MGTVPAQFSTADGSLYGSINGSNGTFIFFPYPNRLFFSVPGVGSLLFRNRLLLDNNADYTEYPGFFLLTFVPNLTGLLEPEGAPATPNAGLPGSILPGFGPAPGDLITAEIFPNGGPTRLRLLDAGLTSLGTQNLRITIQMRPEQVTLVPFLLFRNGRLLTLYFDYTLFGAWITLIAQQQILPGDAYTALIGMGGATVSTVSSYGLTVPLQTVSHMVFQNGIFLTPFEDYQYSSPGTIALLYAPDATARFLVESFIPSSLGDPQFCSTSNGTIFGPVDGANVTFALPKTNLSFAGNHSFIFFNGVCLTVGNDYNQSKGVLTLKSAPQPGDVVSAVLFFSGTSSFFAAVGNGTRRIFNIPNTGSLMVFWNGVLQAAGFDYVASTSAVTMTIAPQVGDIFSTVVFNIDGPQESIQTGVLPGLITGAIDGVNSLFTFPYAITSVILFLNGYLLTEGLDYNLNPVSTGSIQCSTFNGTIGGLVNGMNVAFVLPVAVDAIVFWNGLLLTPGYDYTSAGQTITFTFFAPQPGDIVTAEIFFSPALVYFSTTNGSMSGAVNGSNVNFGFPVGLLYMLFRNGQLLTAGVDYASGGFGATFFAAPMAGDVVTSVVFLSNAPTRAGNIFTFSYAPTGTIVFTDNGQFLTEGYDYPFSGGQTGPAGSVVLFAPQIPQPGDVLTAQIYTSDGPVQATTYDGTLYDEAAVQSMIFENGALQPQPFAATAAGNTVVVNPPQNGSVNVRAWTPDVLYTDQPPFNLPVQFSSVDGSISGVFNGANNSFGLAGSGLVTQVMLWWNDYLLRPDIDYSWTCAWIGPADVMQTTITTLGGNYPLAGDTLTAQVFTS